MSFKQAAEALYRGRLDGAWCAYLIGGEITLRPDLPKIIKAAKSIGYPYIQVMSNGLKLADFNYARKLADAGANIFRLSIHGHKPDLHDYLVGVPGSFKKILKAFENVLKLNAELSVNIALNRHNYKFLEEILKIVAGKFKIEDFNVIFPHYSGAMSEHAEEFKVSVSQAAPYARKSLEYLRSSKAAIEDTILINFSPCNLPEAAHLMSEWGPPGSGAKDDPFFHMDGQNDRVHEIKKRLCVKNKACAGCIYDSKCFGFEKKYAELFGSREFKPVKKRVPAFPLKPSHRRLKRALEILKKDV